MKLIAYCRVSTQGQVRDGLGLPTQERLIRAWAKREGHAIARVIAENGRSGTLPVDLRPGLIEALDAVRTGKASGIVVSDLTRLGRTLTVQEAALGQCWALGGQVYAVDGGEVAADDPDDPMRTAMRQMAGVFAQLDRALTVKRLRNGRETKAGAGGYVGGNTRYGLRSEAGAGELAEDADEARLVERVRALRSEGQSYRQVCAVLTAEGFPTRRGGPWQPAVVRRVATR